MRAAGAASDHGIDIIPCSDPDVDVIPRWLGMFAWFPVPF